MTKERTAWWWYLVLPFYTPIVLVVLLVMTVVGVPVWTVFYELFPDSHPHSWAWEGSATVPDRASGAVWR